VAALLFREGEAWRALLALHTGVVQTARDLAERCNADASLDTTRETIEQREAILFASLTQLASHADALASEALRLRALRKQRCGADVAALEAVLKPQIIEGLTTGSTLASNTGSDVQAATTELRRASITTRAQISAVRGLLEAAGDRVASVGSLGVVLKRPDGTTHALDAKSLIDSAYDVSSELTDESLAIAITSMVVEGVPPKQPQKSERVLVRRSGDGKR
jgi:hypothetical protein